MIIQNRFIIKMIIVAKCMDAFVCPAGAKSLDGFTQQGAQRLVEGKLYGRQVALKLGAMKSRTLIHDF